MRIFDDAGADWREVIGWDSPELDALDELQRMEDEISDSFSLDFDAIGSVAARIEEEEIDKVRALWWVVSWPEGVTTPRYNTDATYAECASKAEALEIADGEYGAI